MIIVAKFIIPVFSSREYSRANQIGATHVGQELTVREKASVFGVGTPYRVDWEGRDGWVRKTAAGGVENFVIREVEEQ